MASWVDRMVGAAMLRVATYEEVEADKGANGQALGVVILSAVAAGISRADEGGARVAILILVARLGWVIWSGMTWLIGTKVLPTKETQADLGQLLRTTGFAAAPGMIRILGAIPFVGWVFELVAWFWMLAAFVVAVRQALDYRSTGRALAVCAIGWVIYFAVFAWALALAGITLWAGGFDRTAP